MPVGAAIAGSAVVGAVATTSAANKGAQAQTNAANQANETQLNIFNQTRQDLSPYNQGGQTATNALLSGLGFGPGGMPQAGQPDLQAYYAAHPEITEGPDGYNANKEAWAKAGIPDLQSFLSWHANNPGKQAGWEIPTVGSAGNYWTNGQGSATGALMAPISIPDPVNYGELLQPIKLDQQTLESLPGYKFDLSQGLKSVQNSAAARGLGASGAALKGAASFATGLADNTYLNQFNTELAQRNQILNQARGLQSDQYGRAATNRSTALGALSGLATLGQNAAAQTGSIGQATGASVGGNITGAGNALAAANIASGNAISGAANTIGNYAYSNQLLRQLAPTRAAPALYGTPAVDAYTGVY